MLHTEELTFRYASGPAFVFPDLKVEKAEGVLILGRSGSGKTTLLHLLAGLMDPSGGEVRIADTHLHALKGSARDRFRGLHIGVVFQQAQFIRSVDVMQNLQLARTLAGLPTDRTLANELLEELGVADRSNVLPETLSTGEKQRVGIVRALMTGPDVVLADEPTSALDDESCERVAQLLERTVTGRGAALIIVTHDQRLKQRFKTTIQL